MSELESGVLNFLTLEFSNHIPGCDGLLVCYGTVTLSAINSSRPLQVVMATGCGWCSGKQ